MKPVPRISPSTALLALALALFAPVAPALATDFSVSGFGTLGYARSDRAYGYQRFIDDRGTVRRDSVAGLQADARFAEGFGATVQVKTAARSDSDTGYEGSIAWAFVSYRPSNDWLFRAGKQRIPFYLFSENYDVGATYDFARLPTEMYSISPSNDFVGGSLSKVWRAAGGEFTFDFFAGRSQTDYRGWLREPVNAADPNAIFGDLKIRGGGLALAHKTEERTLRVALLRVRVQADRPFPRTYPFVEIAPGLGYYQVDPALPGPGVPLNSYVVDSVLTLGSDWALKHDIRLVAEFARVVVPRDDLAPKGNRGYVALLKRSGSWTPYASYAFLRSPARQRTLYASVNDIALPPTVPGAAEINAAQRAGADQLLVYDQSTWAVGTSYATTATTRIKAEFARTRIGDVSSMVDALPGTTVHRATINVLSLSYSVVF